MIQFKEFPKMPRLSREMIITEKIDGTNASIFIQNSNLEEAQQFTKEKIITASKMGIRYFTLLFHDRYFSDEFKTWKDWYV